MQSGIGNFASLTKFYLYPSGWKGTVHLQAYNDFTMGLSGQDQRTLHRVKESGSDSLHGVSLANWLGSGCTNPTTRFKSSLMLKLI
jgi:hypothetical protein